MSDIVERLRGQDISPYSRSAMDEAAAEIERLRSILNTPQTEDFATGAVAEAQHQVYRWGEDHDATKTAWDWYWTLGYLGGKAAHAALARDWDKAKHHTITAAAMLANWHRHIARAALDPPPAP